jgi:hypothetical protein
MPVGIDYSRHIQTSKLFNGSLAVEGQDAESAMGANHRP